jgi:Lar family restriction alleviation protein
MIIDLLPCPFCGWANPVWEVERYASDWITYAATCANCDARGKAADTKQEAAAAWNRRAGTWQPLRHDDPYFHDSPVWLDENGCVCWAGANGETKRLVLYGDMCLCLFVPGEEPTP